MLKKFLFLTLLVMFFVPAVTHAVEIPDVTAGKKHFDFSSGCWVLTDNVYVHWNKRELTIRADYAKAQMGSQKVWARGNITLEWQKLVFKCDNIFVKGKEKLVDILGSVDFEQEGVVKITSNVAQYSWSNKIADFYGNVKFTAQQVNVAEVLKLSNGTYEHVQYDVKSQTILALDKKYKPIPSEMSEPEPQD